MSVTRGGDDRPHELSIWRNREDKGVHVNFERPDYDHKLIKPDANPNAPTPIHPSRRVGGGIGLDENQVRALYKTLHEHLGGHSPADAGTIRIEVDTAEALDHLNNVRREIEKALDALPAFLQGQPTITVTNHFPEPPPDPNGWNSGLDFEQRPDPFRASLVEKLRQRSQDPGLGWLKHAADALEDTAPSPEFDNVPGDEADEESLLDEVLAEARERVGLDPDDEEYGLPVMSRDDAKKLDRLIQNPLGALADALESANLDIPVVNGRSLELFKRLLVREHEADQAPQGPPQPLDLKTTANPSSSYNNKGVQVEQIVGDTEARVFLRAYDQHLTPDEAKQVRDAIDAFVRWAER